MVQAERSYQYNEAGVSTKDQQGEIVKVWLQDSLAHRITEQYYALGSQIHTP
ncbi:LPS-assembly lipoprotein RlpB precursor Rare lipoprotein B [Moraxella catarrhalis]|nr:LPS-assembly lipoprotein RlpB precursor Rare lipoprotein B [Moraxella catarrhalis]